MIQEHETAFRPLRSSSATDPPVPALKVERLERDEAPGASEQPFSTSMDMGHLFVAPSEDSAVVLDTGATADLVCFRWLDHHDRPLEQHGVRSGPAGPSNARFCFGDGRVGDVRYAADTPARVAGIQGKFSASCRGADIPALSPKGATKAPGGKLDSPRDSFVFL